MAAIIKSSVFGSEESFKKEIIESWMHSNRLKGIDSTLDEVTETVEKFYTKLKAEGKIVFIDDV